MLLTVFAKSIFFQVLESIDRGYLVAPQTDKDMQKISSQFHSSLILESLQQNSETKVCHFLSTFPLLSNSSSVFLFLASAMSLACLMFTQLANWVGVDLFLYWHRYRSKMFHLRWMVA